MTSRRTLPHIVTNLHGFLICTFPVIARTHTWTHNDKNNAHFTALLDHT